MAGINSSSYCYDMLQSWQINYESEEYPADQIWPLEGCVVQNKRLRHCCYFSTSYQVDLTMK